MAGADVTIALCVPHAPWVTGRLESMARLREQLGTTALHEPEEQAPMPPGLICYRELTERAPNYVWSEHMWTWGAEGDATHFLTLQDDALVSPHFWLHLRDMLASVPDQVIGLESAHPGFPALPRSVSWATTADMLIGVGYVVPVELLREFLAWRKGLRKGAIETMTEDTMIGVWCLATGRKIWHPIPTIIDHDTEIPSSYGNDQHSNRRPTVTWKDRPETTSWPLGLVPHMGRFYKMTPKLARRWILGATEEDYQRWIA